MVAKKKKKKAAPKKKAIKRKATKKRAIKRRPAKRKAAARKKAIKRRPAQKKLGRKEKIIASITHYFPKVQAAVLKLKAPLTIGDAIKVKGHTTDFTQTVTSMQIDHVPINSAKKGDEIGLLVNSRVRRRDTVFKA